MSRGLERSGVLVGVLILLLSLQFGACLGGAGVCLVAALLLSAGATWLWRHFELAAGDAWVPPLVCAGVALLSTALVELTFRSSFAEWFAPLFAAAGSGAAVAVLRRTEARCGLCNRHLATQDVVFTCPRCTMNVCDETCWSFEHRRCQLCLEQRVPLLPMDEGWWMKACGPRAKVDRCQMCRASADQADLRTCSHCRRPQCRDCWDHNNGECSRCGTALPDLPASLTSTVAQTFQDGDLRPVH